MNWYVLKIYKLFEEINLKWNIPSLKWTFIYASLDNTDKTMPSQLSLQQEHFDFSSVIDISLQQD